MPETPSSFNSASRKGVLDLFGALETLVGSEHIVRRLRARGAGVLRPFQKGFQTLRAVLAPSMLA
jgi:hypothetical protein